MSNIIENPQSIEDQIQALIAQLRQMSQSIPRFTIVPAERRRKIAQRATLSDEYLETVALACDGSPRLTGVVTPAEIRGVIRASHALESLAREAELFVRGLRDTKAELRAEVGTRALDAYSMAQRFNGPEEREELIPHLRAMRVALARSRGRTGPAPDPPPDGQVTLAATAEKKPVK